MGRNFKFQAQDSFLEYFLGGKIRRFVKQIALSEKKPPLKGQCASIFIPKISFQFQPAKFEIFKIELLFQIRKLSELHKYEICWSKTIFHFLI